MAALSHVPRRAAGQGEHPPARVVQAQAGLTATLPAADLEVRHRRRHDRPEAVPVEQEERLAPLGHADARERLPVHRPAVGGVRDRVDVGGPQSLRHHAVRPNSGSAQQRLARRRSGRGRGTGQAPPPASGTAAASTATSDNWGRPPPTTSRGSSVARPPWRYPFPPFGPAAPSGTAGPGSARASRGPAGAPPRPSACGRPAGPGLRAATVRRAGRLPSGGLRGVVWHPKDSGPPRPRPTRVRVSARLLRARETA